MKPGERSKKIRRPDQIHEIWCLIDRYSHLYGNSMTTTLKQSESMNGSPVTEFPYAPFGQWLRSKRMDAGVKSTSAVAQAIGVSRSLVNHWEKGRYAPSLTPIKIITYAKIIGTNPEEMAVEQEKNGGSISID